MPQGHKTGGTVAAEVKMSRMSHAGAFLLLEGKDDVRFWRPRRHGECELVNGEGKQNVVDGIGNLDAAGFRGALGAVDDDYDSIESVEIGSPNHVAHGHDLIEILRIGLMRVLGDLPASTGTAEIARVLRAAISKEELTATNFVGSIRSWEVRNRPYAVLAA